jgi:hypothetical protein
MSLSVTSNAHEIPAFCLTENVGNEPLFLVEETPTHYLVAIDIPSLPAEEVRIRGKNKDLFVEGRPISEFLQNKTYMQFHAMTKACRTIYQEGILWLVMPKYFEA